MVSEREIRQCFQGKQRTNCCILWSSWIFYAFLPFFSNSFFLSLIHSLFHFCSHFLCLLHEFCHCHIITTTTTTQIGLAIVAVSTLVISGIVSYTALCVTAWGYGLALGCYRYTLKMLALERVRAKHFTKAWGK